MSAVLSIVRREMQAYFVSPIAYTMIVIFLVLTTFGFIFTVNAYRDIPASVVEARDYSIRSYIMAGPGGGLTVWVKIGLVLCLPALSMRLFSEERKSGTAELLLTSPITTPQLVLGKFLGSMGVLAVMLGLAFVYPLVLDWIAVVEWPAIWTAYLGYFLYGGTILAIGLLASSLTENQIVALLLTYAIYLPLMLVKLMVDAVGVVGQALAAISVDFGLQKMGLGLVDSHFVVLYLVLMFSFLFLCVQILDSNRWR